MTFSDYSFIIFYYVHRNVENAGTNEQQPGSRLRSLVQEHPLRFWWLQRRERAQLCGSLRSLHKPMATTARKHDHSKNEVCCQSM